ncbi:hypothetical protein EDD15DRAFT_2368739 [Pisolithus albus]|nr:hypothetical protein EDD15DRAFT_2368739 [Pisolithus albus]
MLYMHNLASNPDDTNFRLSNHLSAFRRAYLPNPVPSVIHVVPTLSTGARLSKERLRTLTAQLQRQAEAVGARLHNAFDGEPFDGGPETAWDIVQGLLNVPNLSRRQLEVAENDYVMFVVCPTGAGKTRFTRQLSKSRYVAQGRHPGIENLEAWRCKLGNGPVNIIVIDTPSFRTGRDNVHVRNMITEWLEWNFTDDTFEKCRPGILFLHSLDSDPTCDDMLMSRHLESFAKAFPSKFRVPSRVYVVPTDNPNSTLPSEKLGQQFSQLNAVMEALNGHRNCIWQASMFPGVFKGEPEIAWSAALLFLKDMSQSLAEELIHPPIKPALRRMTPQLPNDRLALKDFADLLFREYREMGWNSDLDAITTLGRTVLELSSPQLPRHHVALTNLADLLSDQFKKEGTDGILDEIITLERATLECMPQNHPGRQTTLLDLDDFLSERFRRGDAIADLEKIVSLRRAVLELTHPPDRCSRQLLNLANALHEKFQRNHSVNDINEAVNLAVDALRLCCPGHPDYPLSQDHLASYLKAKVTTRGAWAHASDTSSSASLDIKQLVKRAFFEKAEKLPPRLLYIPTGVLCNRDAQLSHFENSLQYKELLSSTSPRGSQQLETEVTRRSQNSLNFPCYPTGGGVASRYYATLKANGSMSWAERMWAWSDTCCIDKDSSVELQEAIGSMFSWYHRSSLTIVYLADVADTGSLADSDWFKRGWTLQELLASNTVLFYAKDWSPYVNSNSDSEQHLRNFDPGMEDSRSRLCWASHRRTTRPEDTAYSLFGIFKVQLPVLYGETVEDALGRLLAEIISRSGDVSVLDWVGKQSSFNSSFPANLVSYQATPHSQPIDSGPAKREGLDLEKARKLYNELSRLPLARCVHRRIVLPSIIHPVTAVTVKVSSAFPPRYIHEIHASRLTPLEVTSSVNLDEGAGKYILVRPWHPTSLQTQAGSDDGAIWNLLDQLEQPFHALLLERLLHNQYKRIACDCTITACVQDHASILDSELLTLEVV